MRFPKPCLDCNKITTGGTRCIDCQKRVDQLSAAKRNQIKRSTNQYGGSYKRRAALIRQTAIICWICGEGPRTNDPWQADHVNPGENGDFAELRAAHGSCNRKKSNKTI